MRTVFFVTGTRAEYDILYPVAKAVGATADHEVYFVACAAHLSPFHGLGVKAIERDGIPIAGTVESLVSSESWEGRALSFAHLVEGLTRLFSVNCPDAIFVAGDREEPLAAAMVGNFLGIHVAHLHGGDRCVASDVDEVFRPAISKLSHLHFASTDEHRERLIRMGEDPRFVWNVGATGLDRLREEPDVPDSELNDQFGIDVSKPFFILIQHPASTLHCEDRYQEMAGILEGILSLDVPVFCSYPNTDPGNMDMRRAIDRARELHDNLIVYHNLPRERFVSLYRRCAAVVGNSSSIVIESGFLRVPGILVGPRQNLREAGENVIRIGISSEEVREACLRAMKDESYLEAVRNCPSIYGDGHAAPRIAQILADLELNRDLLLKTITY